MSDDRLQRAAWQANARPVGRLHLHAADGEEGRGADGVGAGGRPHARLGGGDVPGGRPRRR